MKKMKKRNIIYIVISSICVISIFAAVYYQIFMTDNNPSNTTVGDTNTVSYNIDDENIDLEKLKTEFNGLFNNTFDRQGYDISKIKKLKSFESEDVVYMAYEYSREEEGKYNVRLYVPVFNIDGEVAAQVNASTQSVFADTATRILNESKVYTIYNIDYTAYLNENILSLVIRATLKEGDTAQRLIVQTHNYDIETGKLITLNELLEQKKISQKYVNTLIEKYIKEANKQAEAVSMAITGQAIYKRDINNAMYITDNANYFFVGPEGSIYILYPYGNSNYTSEIDIIKM